MLVGEALIQPLAAADGGAGVARPAVGVPIMGGIEIAGPEAFRFEELITKSLAFHNDTRTVVTTPEARYFGAPLEERSLVPNEGDALLAGTTFDAWMAAGAAAKK